MTDYLQPSFYRFNRDSLALVKFVQSHLQAAGTILDLGAGAGIIGIELARYYLPRLLTAVELQQDFLPPLRENVARFLPPQTLFELEHRSFGEWQPRQQWELIVCNPPYFLPGHGEPAQDVRRNLARSFERDGWPVLAKLIARCLSPEGRAFVVIKNLHNLRGQAEAHLNQAGLQVKISSDQDLAILEITGTGCR
jgi:tRNA1Val (adenine37-N6)-methyltransferase